jgi:peptide/nickel transport system permease protein
MNMVKIHRIKTSKHSLSYKLALFFSLFIIFIALFAPFLANDLPLIIVKNDKVRFPVVEQLYSDNYQNVFNEKDTTVLLAVYPPIKWSESKSDYANADFKSPFDRQFIYGVNGESESLNWRDRHWLGTGLRGNDVLSGLIHGAGISLKLGFFSSLISALIGLFIGAFAAWFGNYGLTCSRGKFFVVAFTSLLLIHLFSISGLLSVVEIVMGILTIVLINTLLLKSYNYLNRNSVFNKKIVIPLDSIVLRFLEFFTAFPKIVLILVVAAFWKASFLSVLFLLVLIGWADFARFVRGEVLRLKTLNYVEAARLSGAGTLRILVKHILPNAFIPLIVTFIYMMATNMLIEASLSFLGAGMPANYVTWGSLLADGKENIAAWWLIIFPGLTLTLSIASFYRIARELQN